MSERQWMVVVGVGLLGFLLALWLRRRELARDVPEGKIGGYTLAEIVGFLGSQYRSGLLHPNALEAMRLRPAPWLDPLAHMLNTLVCLDVASGRYREALEWRTRWRARVKGDADALLRINEAEALACLGRFEESLSLVNAVAPKFAWIRLGLASHRAWVLAELGRVEEAFAQALLLRLEPKDLFPREYVAELWFSRFAVALAGRDYQRAHSALSEAGRIVVRESSKRNLHFFRGRLAVAEGKLDEALAAFERGGKSAYRAQGGHSLVEWGDTLAQLGRSEEAREKWQRCLMEDPQSPAAKAAQSRLAAAAVA